MSEIYKKVKSGMPLDDIFIIDGHCHMGQWYNFNVPDGSAESMLVSMDRLGVDIACPTAHPSIGSDYIFGNDMVMDACIKYPDRFIGYVTVNPTYESAMKAELDRCFAVPGMKGIKLHPALHGCPVDFKAFAAAYEAADENNLVMLIHTWGKADIADIDKLAGRYPGARFIIGHSGAEIRAMENAIDVINRHDNCYADLAISMAREGNVEWLVRNVGSEKVIYGTDMPFFDPIPAFGRVAFAEISDNDKKNIFGLNMKKLFKI